LTNPPTLLLLPVVFLFPSRFHSHREKARPPVLPPLFPCRTTCHLPFALPPGPSARHLLCSNFRRLVPTSVASFPPFLFPIEIESISLPPFPSWIFSSCVRGRRSSAASATGLVVCFGKHSPPPPFFCVDGPQSAPLPPPKPIFLAQHPFGSCKTQSRVGRGCFASHVTPHFP